MGAIRVRTSRLGGGAGSYPGSPRGPTVIAGYLDAEGGGRRGGPAREPRSWQGVRSMHRPWLRCWRRWVASGSFWKRQGVRRALSPGAFRRQLGPAHASVLAREPVSDLPAPEPCGGNGCCGELLSEWQCAAAAMVHKYTHLFTRSKVQVAHSPLGQAVLPGTRPRQTSRCGVEKS